MRRQVPPTPNKQYSKIIPRHIVVDLRSKLETGRWGGRENVKQHMVQGIDITATVWGFGFEVEHG